VVQECVSELEVAALFFAEEERASIVEDGFDSRACWARVSNEALGRRIAGPRGFRWLPLVVEWMLSIQDGTGQVERDLGTFQKLLSAHAGPLDEAGVTADDLGRLAFACPVQEEKAIVDGEDGVLKLTPLSKAWQVEWLRCHGRRFCCYKKRKDHGRTGQKRGEGTDRAVQRRRKAACDALAKSKEPLSKLPSILQGSTVAQLITSAFKADPEELKWNTKLKRFHELTKAKVKAAQAESTRRRTKLPPYAKPKSVQGSIFAPNNQGAARGFFFGLLLDGCEAAVQAQDLGRRIGCAKLRRHEQYTGIGLVRELPKHAKCGVLLDSFEQLG
ncbi:unnamed protein product, partial [Effrenium voratum]